MLKWDVASLNNLRLSVLYSKFWLNFSVCDFILFNDVEN